MMEALEQGLMLSVNLSSAVQAAMIDYANHAGPQQVQVPTADLGSFLTLDGIAIDVQDAVLDGDGHLVSGSATVSVGNAELFPGWETFGASITDGDDADAWAMVGGYDVTTGFSLTVDQFSLSVDQVFTAQAEGISIGYNPTIAGTQTLVEIDSGTITFPLLKPASDPDGGVQGSLTGRKSARPADGTLLLYVGNQAAGRVFDTTTTDETYVVTSLGGGTVRGQKLQVSAFGQVQTFDNVLRIQADAAGGDDYISISDNVTAPATLSGGTGIDRLKGGSGDDSIYGQDGRDFLQGGPGQDRLYPGTGDDQLESGTGDDRYVFAAGFNNVQIVERPGEGTDVVDLSAMANLNVAVASLRDDRPLTLTLRPRRPPPPPRDAQPATQAHQPSLVSQPPSWCNPWAEQDWDGPRIPKNFQN